MDPTSDMHLVGEKSPRATIEYQTPLCLFKLVAKVVAMAPIATIEKKQTGVLVLLELEEGFCQAFSFDCGFDRSLLLLFEAKVPVAFRAEVHCGWAAEEAAVVCPETKAFGRLASVLFCHSNTASGTVLGIYEDSRYKSESKKSALKSVGIFGLGTGSEVKKKLNCPPSV
ncbi:hypothetical protein L3X38_000071 [Prunus dulcis]|uniref:Uncharacterized protein n=1 Tax=Prunus dulcis TaxID=3755 RepID=A0AAD4YJU4_PRUDU|nr:hypothetical protein L3X38_000071 [Prunus dulcis]